VGFFGGFQISNAYIFRAIAAIGNYLLELLIHMAHLNTIYLIHASDAPQHLNILKEILVKLKDENRIKGHISFNLEHQLIPLKDQIEEGDLVLTMLTHKYVSYNDAVENVIREAKTENPRLKVAEIIIDHIPYKNDFVSFSIRSKTIS
jgi:hypothetical protein